MSYHDEPIYEYDGKPCRIKAIYTGVDSQQYHRLDIGIVPSASFFKLGRPLYEITIRDILLNHTSDAKKETARLLGEIEKCVYPYRKDEELVPDTVERIVREFIITHQETCWYCDSEVESDQVTCPSCGKQLKFLKAPLVGYLSVQEIHPLSKIVSVLYGFLAHPGGEKWVLAQELLPCLTWIQAQWIRHYQSKQQCWNCYAIVRIRDASKYQCMDCGKHLGFLPESSETLQQKLNTLLANQEGYSLRILTEKLENIFTLDTPLPDAFLCKPYSKQLTNILGKELSSEIRQRIDSLYEDRWWELNRRD